MLNQLEHAYGTVDKEIMNNAYLNKYHFGFKFKHLFNFKFQIRLEQKNNREKDF